MTNKQKTTILFIHHGKGIGGAPLSLLYLVQALDQRFFKPVVLFLHDSDALKMYRELGIETVGPVNRMDFPHTKIWWLRWYHAPMIFRAIKDTLITRFFTAPHWLKKIKPDMVHLNTSSLVAWAIAAHRAKIPVIWHIREPLANGYFGLRKAFVRTCVARYATRIVAISKHDAQPWIKNPKVHIMYNAVPPEKFNPTTDPSVFLKRYNLDPSTPKILFLGGVSREKGTYLICNIFTELLKKLPNAQLLIAGASNTFKPPSNATLLGTIHDTPAAMAASNVIVFPATVGHFARPIIEAGFMKKPVVASNLAPLDELVIHNKTGFLIDHKDTQAWVDALYKLLTNSTLNHSMGKQAYAFCTEHFGLDKQQQIIHELYLETLEKNYEPRNT